MHFDLETLLVIGSALTGLVWLLDLAWLRPQRQAAAAPSMGKAGAPSTPAGETKSVNAVHEPWYIEYSRSFFPVLLVVLVLRAFVAEPFRIPSGSMIPTLLVGDFILVNKFAYGIRLPVIHKKILATSDPERGDVAVFRWPRDPSLDYIKRVIGIPGDRIKYVDKKLYVNGELINTERLGAYEGNDQYSHKMEYALQENLLGVEHEILINKGRRNLDYIDVVPEGHYFVMGDNRDNSNDSRFWGFVPKENLVGRALFIWMNWDAPNKSVNFSRIGTKIK
ncbi:MAG TPA: signal peptidase I [Gammaproteobacteria bacterium]|nr:signal peptidase I [Gammaproteobacteria bacterium]